ncbi:MAG: AMP-binding protein [Candidatus Dependentiae bacterium]|nr:AMP-binding protein [Candidatus Dependentiae bacterium]
MSIKKQLYGYDHDAKQLFDKLYQESLVDGKLLCLGQLLERAVKRFPDNVALIWQDRSITFKELYYRASLLSTKLLEKGVQPRDRVLLFFENSFEFYVGYFAIVQVGAVVAPLNFFLGETELRHIVHDAQPKMIITASSNRENFEKVDAQKYAQFMTEEDMDLVTAVPHNVELFAIRKLEPHEMAALLYTSGTTGLPKGVMLSSKNIMTNVLQLAACHAIYSTDRVFGILPLFHSFAQNAFVWMSTFSGYTVILLPKIERRYIEAGLKHKPTVVFGVPALFGLFCLLKTLSFDTVRVFLSGADVLPDKIRAAFALVYRRKLYNGYGLTETSPAVSIDLGAVTEPTNCIGIPLVGLEVAIRDEKGQKVSDGTIGDLTVKGDNVMLGYYNAPEMTAATIKDGWLYTGDLAYIDPNGKIVIAGRLKDLIIHKGFNIYPQEIENVLMLHPNVIRVGVVGKLDESGTEVPVAFLQVRVAQPGIEKELKQLCLNHLANYKVPREFFVTTENLPVTATAKVDKKVLRKRLNPEK